MTIVGNLIESVFRLGVARTKARQSKQEIRTKKKFKRKPKGV